MDAESALQFFLNKHGAMWSLDLLVNMQMEYPHLSEQDIKSAVWSLAAAGRVQVDFDGRISLIEVHHDDVWYVPDGPRKAS